MLLQNLKSSQNGTSSTTPGSYIATSKRKPISFCACAAGSANAKSNHAQAAARISRVSSPSRSGLAIALSLNRHSLLLVLSACLGCRVMTEGGAGRTIRGYATRRRYHAVSRSAPGCCEPAPPRSIWLCEGSSFKPESLPAGRRRRVSPTARSTPRL